MHNSQYWQYFLSKDQGIVNPIKNTILYSHSKFLDRMLKEEPKSIPVQK